VNPFARVAEALVSTDQSLPPELESEFWKRDGQLPQVFSLRLDTNFHDIDFTGCVLVPIRSTVLFQDIIVM
jgi:hypothetical protein